MSEDDPTLQNDNASEDSKTLEKKESEIIRVSLYNIEDFSVPFGTVFSVVCKVWLANLIIAALLAIPIAMVVATVQNSKGQSRKLTSEQIEQQNQDELNRRIDAIMRGL
ncbi:MAG: hypothetical protein FWG02_10590 [Holophagaceae bacterium]|nr:hypothetical protein [Holophagaceae bacterium]